MNSKYFSQLSDLPFLEATYWRLIICDELPFQIFTFDISSPVSVFKSGIYSGKLEIRVQIYFKFFSTDACD